MQFLEKWIIQCLGENECVREKWSGLQTQDVFPLPKIKLEEGSRAERNLPSVSSKGLPLWEDVSVGAAVLQGDAVSSVRDRVPDRVEGALRIVDGHVLQHRGVPHKGIVPKFHLPKQRESLGYGLPSLEGGQHTWEPGSFSTALERKGSLGAQLLPAPKAPRHWCQEGLGLSTSVENEETWPENNVPCDTVPWRKYGLPLFREQRTHHHH